MNEKFQTVLSLAIVPQVVDLMIREQGMEETAALKAFYTSETYRLLSDENTKLWHYGYRTLYDVWKGERQTGKVVLPEEGGCA